MAALELGCDKRDGLEAEYPPGNTGGRDDCCLQLQRIVESRGAKVESG